LRCSTIPLSLKKTEIMV